MKRILSLALVLMLALSLMPAAVQAEDTLKFVVFKEERFPTETSSVHTFSMENTSDHEIKVTVTVYDQAARQNVATMNYVLPANYGPEMVLSDVWKHLTNHGEVNTYSYKVATDGGLTRYLYFAQKLTIEKDSNGVEKRVYTQYENSFYPRNTVSSFGPHFRDVTPNLTDKWYMFTPVDLTIQGRQTFVLVASNMYEVGEVYVDVNEDTVMVSYRMFNSDKADFKTENLSEFLTFYNSYADVGIVEPEDMKEPSMYAFNQPISILNHFGGDTNVLMFVRNRITYYRFPSPKTEYIRFWENKPEYKTMREHMLTFMDPIMTVGS